MKKLKAADFVGHRCRLSVVGVARDWFGEVVRTDEGDIELRYDIPGMFPAQVDTILENKELDLVRCDL